MVGGQHDHTVIEQPTDLEEVDKPAEARVEVGHARGRSIEKPRKMSAWRQKLTHHVRDVNVLRQGVCEDRSIVSSAIQNRFKIE